MSFYVLMIRYQDQDIFIADFYCLSRMTLSSHSSHSFLNSQGRQLDPMSFKMCQLFGVTNQVLTDPMSFKMCQLFGVTHRIICRFTINTSLGTTLCNEEPYWTLEILKLPYNIATNMLCFVCSQIFLLATTCLTLLTLLTSINTCQLFWVTHKDCMGNS